MRYKCPSVSTNPLTKRTMVFNCAGFQKGTWGMLPGEPWDLGKLWVKELWPNSHCIQLRSIEYFEVKRLDLCIDKKEYMGQIASVYLSTSNHTQSEAVLKKTIAFYIHNALNSSVFFGFTFCAHRKTQSTNFIAIANNKKWKWIHIVWSQWKSNLPSEEVVCLL